MAVGFGMLHAVPVATAVLLQETQSMCLSHFAVVSAALFFFSACEPLCGQQQEKPQQPATGASSVSSDSVVALEARAAKGDVDAMTELGKRSIATADFRAGAVWYRRAAEKGHPEAMFRLAEAYDVGQGVDRDQAKAFGLFAEAAGLGYSLAFHRVGICLVSGAGAKRDAAKAFSWFRKAADIGVPEAMNAMGMMLSEGFGVEKDVAAAADCFQRAAKLGSSDAAFNCAELNCWHGSGKDRIAAAEAMKSLADAGDSGAMLFLAMRYLDGNANLGIIQDTDAAYRLMRKAADKGNPNAIYNCALLSFEEKKFDTAMAWCAKGEELGESSCILLMGKMHEDGLGGVVQDYGKALAAYRKSAQMGNPTAMANIIGLLTNFGPWDDAHAKEVMKWGEKGVFMGDVNCVMNLGVTHERGGNLFYAYTFYSVVAAYDHEMGAPPRDRVARSLNPEQMRQGQKEAGVMKEELDRSIKDSRMDIVAKGRL